MPNIASMLKEEIGRVARKEIRKQTGQLKRLSAAHRRHIAALKRQLVKLERDLNLARREVARGTRAGADDAGDKARPGRFVAKGLRSLRTRLGLSAAEFAKLVGVTGQTIYNWEQKKASPRNEQLAVLASLRGLGKREVMARLNGESTDDAAPEQAKGGRRKRGARKVTARKAVGKRGARKSARKVGRGKRAKAEAAAA